MYGLTAPRIRHILIVLAASVVFTAVAYDIGYILTAPFWWDELWVAVSARFPLSDLPAITSSTPIGWNVLQQSFSTFGEQAQRIVPLIFVAASSTTAYFLGYVATVGTRRAKIATGAFVGTAVALSPLLLARTDLKQYTADIFFTLLIVTLATLADRWNSRPPLYSLTIVSSLGMLFTLTIPFTAATAFAALLVAALLNRQWARIRPILVGGTIAGASIIVMYLGLYFRSQGALQSYWKARGYFPSPLQLPKFLVERMGDITGITRFALDVIILLVVLAVLVAGILLARRSRRFVPALFIVFLAAGMALLGMAKIYPFLDTRTSLFLILAVVATSALTVAHGVRWAVERFVRESSRVTVITSALVVSLIAITAVGVPSLHSHTMYVDNFTNSSEDARSQINYLKVHRAAGDVIITDLRGAMAMGYYWPALGGHWQAVKDRTNGFVIAYPDSANVIVVSQNAPKAEFLAAVTGALSKNPTATVWFVETHHAGKPVIGATNVPETVSVEKLDVGPEPLYRLLAAPTP
jgi:hypothetical protein